MKFLHDKRQAGVLALLSVLLGAAVLMFGAGGANADTCTTTDGTLGDATVYVPGVVAADLTQDAPGMGFWACAVPPGQGFGYAIHDANPDTPGYQVESSGGGPLWSDYIEDDTGAEVDPTTSTNEPYDAATGTGGSAGVGDETCVYVDGTSDCPFGIEIASLTVNEGDAAVGYAYNLNGGWVTAGGVDVVQLPYGAGVMVGRGTNSSADTVDGSVAGTVDVTTDVGGCYVSYNTDETTCS